jgi:hypothetical protein
VCVSLRVCVCVRVPRCVEQLTLSFPRLSVSPAVVEPDGLDLAGLDKLDTGYEGVLYIRGYRWAATRDIC